MVPHKEKRTYQIILGCCLLYAAVSGIGGNCKGIFYTPMAETLRVSLPQLTFASTLSGIVSACCMIPCCAFFRKVSARVSITVMGTCYCISQILMGFTNSLQWYYVCTCLQGVFSGFLIYYPIQHIVGNWFPQKSGTALGFVLMSSGIVGMIVNPLATSWIESFGWRVTYRLLGLFMLLLVLPAALLLLQKSPREVSQESSQPQAHSPSFAADTASEPSANLFALFALLLFLDLCIALTQHLPSFAVSTGRTAVFGASLVSTAMLGNLIGKIALGTMNDRFGAAVTTVIGICTVALGCVGMTVDSSTVILLSAFLVGTILSVITLQIPLIFRRFCSPAVYEKVFPVVCSVNIIVGAASHTVLSLGYSAFQSYKPVFLLAAADMVLCIILTIWIGSNRKSSRPFPIS